jgi:uncharacterized protein (TIGR02145 family)
MTKNNLKLGLSLFIAILFVQFNYGQTTIIGTQVWMTKNLDVSTFRNGEAIPQAKSDNEWKAFAQAGEAAWCFYDNDPKNGKTYGKLYNWYALNDPRGLAPNGFHIPSDEEWTILNDYLGEGVAGKKMKSASGWSKNGNGTNSSSFSGLPGGYRNFDGTFLNIGTNGNWWSSTEKFTDAWFRFLSYYGGYVIRDYVDKTFGLSVRCLRD